LSDFREEGSSISRKSKPFNDLIDKRSADHAGSRIILALDIPHRRSTKDLLKDSVAILDKVWDLVAAVKINFHLVIPLSLEGLSELNDRIHTAGLCSIADIKLNDIDNTNEIATDYLWDAGFDAVIVNPFAGFKGGLDVVYNRGRQLNKGVISLAYMSHQGADESYGLETSTGASMFEIMIERANLWDSDGVILGTTRIDKIRDARSILRKSIKIISPGSGSQGGDPLAALKAGGDYLIFGRSLINAGDPRDATLRISEALKSQG
jgi:orotidine-5'-phosphate decarboxylase